MSSHIIIVDDSPTETLVLRRMLETGGFHVSNAVNAEKGLEKIKTEMPDLVLMDVVMPGMNGFQATRQLSVDPETSHIPVVIVTTKSSMVDMTWGLKQGARDFLGKPVKQDALIACVRKLLVEPEVTEQAPKPALPSPAVASQLNPASAIIQARTILNEHAKSGGLFNGFRFTMKLEQCYTAQELRALYPAYRTMVGKSMGMDFADFGINRVEQILAEAV